MYKVLKDTGFLSSIVIENTSTHATVNIGRPSVDILRILSTAGHKVGEDGLEIRDQWELVVEEEVGKELARSAMTMSRPIRNQRKVKEEQPPAPKKDNSQIDAMDVLLGLADYN